MKEKNKPLRNTRDDYPDLSTHIDELTESIAEIFQDIPSQLQEAITDAYPESDQERSVLINHDTILNEIQLDELTDVIEERNKEAVQVSAEHHATRLQNNAEKRYNLPSDCKVAIDFDLTDTFTLQSLREQALQSTTSINDAVRDQLATVLLQGAEEGNGIDKIQRSLKEAVESLSTNHARLVARTETLSASRQGSQALAESTNLIAGKEWIATNDARTRPWHKTMNGVVVAKNDLFTVPRGWTGPPHYQPTNYPRSVRVVGQDQPYNCRCSQSPVIREDMPDNIRTADDLTLKGLTHRQVELWQSHAKPSEKTFQAFWTRVRDEYSTTKTAKNLEMSQNTVRKYDKELEQ